MFPGRFRKRVLAVTVAMGAENSKMVADAVKTVVRGGTKVVGTSAGALAGGVGLGLAAGGGAALVAGAAAIEFGPAAVVAAAGGALVAGPPAALKGSCEGAKAGYEVSNMIADPLANVAGEVTLGCCKVVDSVVKWFRTTPDHWPAEVVALQKEIVALQEQSKAADWKERVKIDQQIKPKQVQLDTLMGDIPTIDKTWNVTTRIENPADFIEFNKDEDINIGVAGPTGIGKSTLINKFFSSEVAPTSMHGECTMVPKAHTSEQNIFVDKPVSETVRLWDLPGHGTPSFPPESYVKEMGLVWFDAIILVVGHRLEEAEVTIFEVCRMRKIPCYIVRNRMDETLSNAKMKKFDVQQTFEEALPKMQAHFIQHSKEDFVDQAKDRFFAISSQDDDNHQFSEQLKPEWDKFVGTLVREVFVGRYQSTESEPVSSSTGA